MPPGEWRSIRGSKCLVWGYCIAIWCPGIIAGLMVMNWMGIATIGHLPSAGTMSILTLGGTAAAIALWAVAGLRERRFQRAVRALQCDVCLNCGYSLKGLPDSHRCPECGVAYDRKQVRSTWESRFARSHLSEGKTVTG